MELPIFGSLQLIAHLHIQIDTNYVNVNAFFIIIDFYFNATIYLNKLAMAKEDSWKICNNNNVNIVNIQIML